MRKKDMDRSLSKFGYSIKWLEYGILNKEFFDEQISEQSKTNHTGWEHYRYGAFCNWLNTRTSASNQDITNFIELALNDSDISMGQSAALSLLETPWLTNDQFELVKHNLLNIAYDLTKQIQRQELLRELSQKELDNELFNKCLNQGDGKVHMTLIEHKGITKNMIKDISESGANKKVRNIAQQLYKSNKIA